MRGLMIGHASEFMIGRSFLPVIRSSVAGMRLSNKPSVEKAHVAPMVLALRLTLSPVAGVSLSQQTCAHHYHA